jgi:hypothetical protein
LHGQQLRGICMADKFPKILVMVGCLR